MFYYHEYSIVHTNLLKGMLPHAVTMETHCFVFTEEGVLLKKAEGAFLTSLNIAIEVNHFLLNELQPCDGADSFCLDYQLPLYIQLIYAMR